MKTIPGQLELWSGDKECVRVLVPTKKRQKDFCIFNQRTGMMIALDPDLTAQDHRILWAYICEADYDLYIWTSQAEIGRMLSLPSQRVCEAVKRLIGKKLLLEEAKVGRRKVYRLSPLVFRKGHENKQFIKFQKEQDRQLKLIS